MHEDDTGLVIGADGKARCWWGAAPQIYVDYHDREWGRPVRDDHRLFEKICLEGFQSGLSWLTILKKRERFREVFEGFDFEVVAKFGTREVERLVTDAGIIRHRGKIESTLNNAKRAIELADEAGGLANYFWSFRPEPSERPKRMIKEELYRLSNTPTSTRMSKDLKKRGWSFVGPTTCYAFMQAMGLVNDHLEGCWVREEIEAYST